MNSIKVLCCCYYCSIVDIRDSKETPTRVPETRLFVRSFISLLLHSSPQSSVASPLFKRHSQRRHSSARLLFFSGFPCMSLGLLPRLFCSELFAFQPHVSQKKNVRSDTSVCCCCCCCSSLNYDRRRRRIRLRRRRTFCQIKQPALALLWNPSPDPGAYFWPLTA